MGVISAEKGEMLPFTKGDEPKMTNGYIVPFPVSVGRTDLFIISLILQKKR